MKQRGLQEADDDDDHYADDGERNENTLDEHANSDVVVFRLVRHCPFLLTGHAGTGPVNVGPTPENIGEGGGVRARAEY